VSLFATAALILLALLSVLESSPALLALLLTESTRLVSLWLASPVPVTPMLAGSALLSLPAALPVEPGLSSLLAGALLAPALALTGLAPPLVLSAPLSALATLLNPLLLTALLAAPPTAPIPSLAVLLAVATLLIPSASTLLALSAPVALLALLSDFVLAEPRWAVALALFAESTLMRPVGATPRAALLLAESALVSALLLSELLRFLPIVTGSGVLSLPVVPMTLLI